MLWDWKIQWCDGNWSTRVQSRFWAGHGDCLSKDFFKGRPNAVEISWATKPLWVDHAMTASSASSVIFADQMSKSVTDATTFTLLLCRNCSWYKLIKIAAHVTKNTRFYAMIRFERGGGGEGERRGGRFDDQGSRTKPLGSLLLGSSTYKTALYFSASTADRKEYENWSVRASRVLIRTSISSSRESCSRELLESKTRDKRDCFSQSSEPNPHVSFGFS